MGRWDEALAAHDRALRMSRATMAPTDLNLVHSLINRGDTLVRLRRYDEARSNFDEAIAMFDKNGGENANLAVGLASRGDLAMRRGRCDEAIADHTRAIAVLDKMNDPTFYGLLHPLTGKGSCLVQMGRPADAIPVLERALRCKVGGGEAFEVARAQAYLGRARVATGHDVAGGLAQVRAARPAIAASPEGVEELRMLDRWLATHAR